MMPPRRGRAAGAAAASAEDEDDDEAAENNEDAFGTDPVAAAAAVTDGVEFKRSSGKCRGSSMRAAAISAFCSKMFSTSWRGRNQQSKAKMA